MSETSDHWQSLSEIIEGYVAMLRQELLARWQDWKLDLAHQEVHEVVGGLLARQVSIACRFARSPHSWNGHAAPLFLRSLVDGLITLAWISLKPDERARSFIAYGLGQEKLILEQRKTQLQKNGIDPDKDEVVRAQEAWINSQRWHFLVEVNVGNWSGTDVRTMAKEAQLEDLYIFAYTPFSGATHNMWQHVSRYNLETCNNPLHRYHLVPSDKDDREIDVWYLVLCARYVEESFQHFDKKFLRLEPEESDYKSGQQFLEKRLESFPE